MSEKKQPLLCPDCGAVVSRFRNPVPTVDIIIRLLDHPEPDNILLIKRKNPPYGWALPGGFVDYGETVESTAIREAKEETGLDVKLRFLVGVYSEPNRDPRSHTITTVFAAEANGVPIAADDAQEVKIYMLNDIPESMAFDHRDIIEDYKEMLNK